LCLLYVISKYKDKVISRTSYLNELASIKEILNKKDKYDNDLIIDTIILLLSHIKFGKSTYDNYRKRKIAIKQECIKMANGINDFIFTEDGIRTYIFKYFRKEHPELCYYWIHNKSKIFNLIKFISKYNDFIPQHLDKVSENFATIERKDLIISAFIKGQKSGHDCYLYRFFLIQDNTNSLHIKMIKNNCYLGWCFFQMYHDEITFLQSFTCDKILYSNNCLKIPIYFNTNETKLLKESNL
jgi:hypothetical protein